MSFLARILMMDSGLHSIFSLTDRQKMTLNHAVFSNPTAATNNVNFGKMLSAGVPGASLLIVYSWPQ